MKICTFIKVCACLTVLCSVTRPKAKPENVGGNPKKKFATILTIKVTFLVNTD